MKESSPIVDIDIKIIGVGACGRQADLLRYLWASDIN